LLRIVSEKTGYPTEMLALDMDMEADLGIDSIKRVEILGALQEAHPHLPEIQAQALAELRTLASIVEAIQSVAPPVEVKPQAAAPTAEPVSAAPAVSGGEDIAAVLLGIISEKTGYPVEMLNLSMDMEADLGIDSIKRVEILGALQDRVPALPEIDTSALGELRTLAQIVGYVGERTGAPKKA
jgi:acyl carrier protein